MTHEPIRVIHFSPHITWQGTQSELDAMLAEGWPMGSASEIIAACKRDAAEAIEDSFFAGFEEGYQTCHRSCGDPTPAFKVYIAKLKGETNE
jgi:hypothetical protein